MHEVEIDRARKDLPQLIEEAMSGADVVITKDRRPLVRLVNAAEPPRRRRRSGSAKGLITIADDFDEPLDDLHEYM